MHNYDISLIITQDKERKGKMWIKYYNLNLSKLIFFFSAQF